MSDVIEKLRAVACPPTARRPWIVRNKLHVVGATGRAVAEAYVTEDAALLVAAVNALPALLDVAEAAQCETMLVDRGVARVALDPYASKKPCGRCPTCAALARLTEVLGV